MKNLKYYLAFFAVILTNTIFSQETIVVEEVEETVIETTESSNYRTNRRNVKNIYKKGEHFLTGNIDNEVYIIKNNATNLYGLQDFNGNLLVRPMFKSVNKYSSSKNRIIVSIDYSKHGIIDKNGEIIVPLVYSSISSQNNKQLFILSKSYSNYSIVDYNGKAVLDGNFERISVYNDVIKVKRNDAYGVFTTKGEELLPLEYDKIEYNTTLKFFSVTKNGVNSILKRNGEKLFSNNYSEVESYGSYRNSQFLVGKNDLKGIISLDEKTIIPIKFQDIDRKNNYQLYTVQQNNLWGLYDSYFDKFLIKPVYKEVHKLSNTVYLLISDTKKTIRDINYKTNVDVSEFNFPSYYLSSSKYLKTEKDNKFGLLDVTTGKQVVPTKYDKVRSSYGYMSGYDNKDKKYTAYDKEGKVIAKNFNNIKSITSNLYKLTKKGKAGLIYNGNLIADIEYDIVTYYRNVKLIVLVKKSTYSLLDYVTGEMIIKDSKERISVNSSTNKITHNNKKYFYSSGQLKEE